MSIFQKKEQSIAEKLADEIVSNNVDGLDNFISDFTANFWRVWTPPESTSVQEIFDVFGAEASQLFAAASATIAFIQTLKPDYIPPIVPYEFTIHENGTVTVGNKKDDQ